MKKVSGKVKADVWNGLHPSGTPVFLRNYSGVEEETFTRSEAWLLGSGRAVVLVVGRTGGYSLDRIRPRSA